MTRFARLLPGAGFVLAVVGLVLLVLEVVRTLKGSALGSLGAILLWVGVGFIAVAILLLALSVISPEADAPPADADTGAEARA